jgi:hypothetical protein
MPTVGTGRIISNVRMTSRGGEEIIFGVGPVRESAGPCRAEGEMRKLSGRR